VTRLELEDKNLEGSLKIEGFNNLKRFDCSNNQLTSLDLSLCHNIVSLHFSGNSLNDLSFISKLPSPENLKTIDISNNNFSLDDLSVFLILLI
jgi:Leucine-rich repeat (LRR) protein